MRTVLRSLLSIDSDPHVAAVAASRVAFALEIMCQKSEQPESPKSENATAVSKGTALTGSCSRAETPATPSPRDLTGVQSQPSTVAAPRTQVKASKAGKALRAPFVPVVSRSSATAAASSATSARRSRVKQLRLFPEPGSAVKSNAPGYLRERSLETRQERRVRGNAAQNFAATTIAACWHGCVARTAVRRVRAAQVLQRGWRQFQSRLKLTRLRQAAAQRRHAREVALEMQRLEAERLAVRQREELEWRKKTQKAQEKLRAAASHFSLSGKSRPL